MGFEFKETESIDSNLMVSNYEISEVNQTWEQPWGEQKVIKDEYNRLLVTLNKKTNKKRTIQIEFKVFNNGIGFRYIFPKQGMDSLTIMDELTEFSFTIFSKSKWYNTK